MSTGFRIVVFVVLPASMLALGFLLGRSQLEGRNDSVSADARPDPPCPATERPKVIYVDRGDSPPLPPDEPEVEPEREPEETHEQPAGEQPPDRAGDGDESDEDEEAMCQKGVCVDDGRLCQTEEDCHKDQ